jgi:nucleoid-associated protein EbfC
MSSIAKLMKRALRLQQQMELVQVALAKRTAKATNSDGGVKVTAKCDGSLARIQIKRQALNLRSTRSLESMILEAANQALGRAKKISDAEMEKVTDKLSLRGLT